MFKDKTIAIIGCGGLGGYVCEETARLNPKKIILFDGDQFFPSNLNRQLFSTKETIGLYKAERTAYNLKSITDSVVVYYNEFLNLNNLNKLDEADLVFDCLDNIDSRLLLSSYCFKNNIPLIHGAISSNYGEVCLCLKDRDILKELYKDKKEEKSPTNSFSVAAVASYQVALANKYFSNNYDDIIDKLVIIDLEELTIKKLKI